MTTTFSLKQGETRTSSEPIITPLMFSKSKLLALSVLGCRLQSTDKNEKYLPGSRILTILGPELKYHVDGLCMSDTKIDFETKEVLFHTVLYHILVSLRFVTLYATATWIPFKIPLLCLIQQWIRIAFFCHLRCRAMTNRKLTFNVDFQ